MWGGPLLVALGLAAFYRIDRQEAKTVTLANYHRIMEGMTTQEVEAILDRGEERDPSMARTYTIAMANRIASSNDPMPDKYLFWRRRDGAVIEIGFKEGKVLTIGTNLNKYPSD